MANLINPDFISFLHWDLLQHGLLSTFLPVPAEGGPPAVTAVAAARNRKAQSGSERLRHRKSHNSHHGSVEISDLEDVKIVLCLHILLHGDVLARHGHHAGHVLICCLCLHLDLAQTSVCVANFEDTGIPTAESLGTRDLGKY